MAVYGLALLRRNLSITGLRHIWTSRILLQNQSQSTGVEEQSVEGSGNENDEEYEANIKSKILSAALPFVHDYGWSQEAIAAGAESIGYPGIIHGMFSNGGVELVQHFYSTCNMKLNKMLMDDIRAIQDDPSKKRKDPEKQVCDALKSRLKMLIPYKKTWPQAMALMALPPNVPTSLANILTLVDDICYHAGDRSVDFNWYTRRVALAGIYKATELYMLQDKSENHKETWKFLERRIEDAISIYKVLSVTSEFPPPDEALNRATEAATAAFVTARNILGINWNR
ncbi:ubiquinone biosynthesis protein COQ9, mitochondrial isoform X2 [Orussus abietinus]|uniref:ubiquinone biosynthesis protein COQ9, mitochondrial isoform X2 n=1 Tax=Orussus abietinus TaxID=222816 RepID=UPI00062640FF|nr:ubiquinone biosynthesis protein COQ9, mitochondrial isoform X2 [Orussus abietinus]